MRATHASPTPGDAGIAQLRAVLDAEAYLESVATRLAAPGLDVQTGIPYVGSTADWIVDEASMRHADLIVMATHDRVGPDRWLHGSVAEGVVGRASVPILLVPATDSLALGQRFDEAQPALIVPLDGSASAEAALPVACDVALALGGRVILVDVVPGSDDLVAAQGGVVTYLGSDHERLEAERLPPRYLWLPDPHCLIGHAVSDRGSWGAFVALVARHK